MYYSGVLIILHFQISKACEITRILQKKNVIISGYTSFLTLLVTSFITTLIISFITPFHFLSHNIINSYLVTAHNFCDTMRRILRIWHIILCIFLHQHLECLSQLHV